MILRNRLYARSASPRSTETVITPRARAREGSPDVDVAVAVRASASRRALEIGAIDLDARAVAADARASAITARSRIMPATSTKRPARSTARAEECRSIVLDVSPSSRPASASSPPRPTHTAHVPSIDARDHFNFTQTLPSGNLTPPRGDDAPRASTSVRAPTTFAGPPFGEKSTNTL